MDYVCADRKHRRVRDWRDDDEPAIDRHPIIQVQPRFRLDTDPMRLFSHAFPRAVVVDVCRPFVGQVITKWVVANRCTRTVSRAHGEIIHVDR